MKSQYLNYSILLILILCFVNCNTMPSNYSLKQVSNDTNLIDTNICYVTPLGCIDNFFLISKFSSSGKVYSTTTSVVDSTILVCFQDQTSKTTLCKNIIEGNYRISSDTIYTQSIRKDGMGFVIFREYKIHSDQDVSLISDYIEAKHTRVGFASNYPSFYSNDCGQLAQKVK